MLDESTLKLTEPYITPSYTTRSCERLSRTRKKFAKLLQEGCLPEQGFSEADLEALFLQLGTLDSNNWCNSVGVGEREGRVLLEMIRRRHFGLTHGIGRSGDITAIQPKAPGSSLINRLTNRLVLDWLKKSGSPSTSTCFVVPMATGMTLTLCLLALKQRRPPGAKFVIWPRIDQKSCFKCMLAAGLIPIPIEPTEGSPDPKCAKACCDQLNCDIPALREALKHPAAYLLRHWPESARAHSIVAEDAERCGPDSVVCVLSTTLCFSPRAPDRLHAITDACIEHGVSHLINNAYGVQSVRCMRMIEAAGHLILQGRKACSGETPSDDLEVKDLVLVGDTKCGHPTDSPGLCNEKHFPLPSTAIDMLYVQSTDKNLLVPVGGAVVAGFSSELVDAVAKSYPGRASATQSVDVLATLLHLGLRGWRELTERRCACFNRLKDGLEKLAKSFGLNLMATADNPISLALHLNPLVQCDPNGLLTSKETDTLKKLTVLGAQLFTQGCSGVRVVLPASIGTSQQLGAYTFRGFGSHSSRSTKAYLNAASAVGQTEEEVDLFLAKLHKVLEQFKGTLKKGS
ncbi:unnamed protein product [Dicrocoelium dendriticum]|nr:unnamed protein product [Dicrocoelium dendriticum]